MHRNENYLRGQFGEEGKRSNALARNGVRFTQKINCNQFSVSKEYTFRVYYNLALMPLQ